MQKMGDLRNRQLAITEDFKSRAQKAEKILDEIDVCEKKLSALNESLSAVLGIDVAQAAASKFPKVKSAKAAKVKAAKLIKVAKTAKVVPTVKPPAGQSLKDIVRDFLAREGKPMRIAEIVQGMQKAGHVFQSKKPGTTMGQLMYNHAKVFKRVKPGTFKAV